MAVLYSIWLEALGSVWLTYNVFLKLNDLHLYLQHKKGAGTLYW